MKTFNPLNVSSKFAICGLPIRMDTYKFCTFGCKYCFSNNREIMKFDKNIQVANLSWLDKKLDKVLNQHKFDSSNFLDVLIDRGFDFHCGGMSDPFQPCEEQYKITSQAIDICNSYNRHILFSTKANTVYEANIRPDLHTFQLSVTNVANRTDLEPNVPSIDERLSFYKNLKKDGFKVGIRIQPFIPNISNLEIVKMFEDADNFTLEGIKIVPQNKEHKEFILQATGLKQTNFTQMGLLNLKPEIRLKMYEPFIEYFEKKNIPFSIADNDLHHIGTNKCCCGDNLIHSSTNFNNTAMIKKYTADYKIDNINYELQCDGCAQCKCNQLFTSNRQEGCVTVEDFYNKRFDRKSSPFSPLFLYKPELCNSKVKMCECCNTPITSGYHIVDSQEYFCSDDCLRSTYSPEEYMSLCENNQGYYENLLT